MERQVIYAREVEGFFDELLIALFEKGYFGFSDTAKLYTEKLTFYIEKHIGLLPCKSAPNYFNRYGVDLRYITYQSNKKTTWYILFQQRDNVFLIRHITNNHIAGQYFI